jgi:starch synthase
LSHRIEAGADFFLMPSFFEPCGLNQMYSQRYGTIPIVRVTGGLDDSVRDFTEVDSKDGYRAVVGIKFRQYTSRALARAMQKAFAIYEKPDLLQYIRMNAMRADYSWERTAGHYVEAYRKLTETLNITNSVRA